MTSLATAAFCVGGLTFADSAHAVDSVCTGMQSKSFSTPGFDTDVKLQVCIQESPTSPASEDYRTYTAVLSGVFTDGGGGSTRKFDNFDLEIRLESSPAGGTGSDYVDSKAVCDVTASINRDDSAGLRCQTGLKMHVNMRPRVTGDATVRYDIDADGKGALGPWDLTGSPHL
ncbi:hypothetical protein [Streptomyces sp. STR69]|uniref:hypothetical protein n=1 Tax=Streptomyces sp. STR69 TaxID=1796942 RepID=UPI0021CAB087|nr:hypothetical protein [Streptomyces sp. STR69]